MLTVLDDFLFCISWPFPLLIIIVLMCGLGYLFVKIKQLSVSGALAAVIEGTVILWCLRFEGFFLFFVLYLSCIALEKYVSMENPLEKPRKNRELVSVLAKGTMAVIASLHYYNTGYYGALLMFGAAVAETASDTWSGVIGSLSKKDSVSIRTFRVVKKGLSGGVTPLGFVAGFIAVVFIGLIWLFCFPINNRGIGFTIICFSGFTGCIFDSFLGATCQALYEDAVTGELTENEKSSNGEDNKLVRGYEWLDNDGVDFVSNFVSAIAALALSAILF